MVDEVKLVIMEDGVKLVCNVMEAENNLVSNVIEGEVKLVSKRRVEFNWSVS